MLSHQAFILAENCSEPSEILLLTTACLQGHLITNLWQWLSSQMYVIGDSKHSTSRYLMQTEPLWDTENTGSWVAPV